MIRKRPIFTRPSVSANPASGQPSLLARIWFGFWRRLGRGVRGVCIFLGAVVLLSAFVNALFLGGMAARKNAPLPEEFVISLKLDEGLNMGDESSGGIFPRGLFAPDVTVYDMIDAIERAAADDRAKALVVHLESGDFPITAVQELRKAIAIFRATGRPTIVFTPSFADASANFTAYYLAAAFDEIWMQPVGMIFLTGIDAEAPYMRNALEKIGVRGEYFQRQEYKNAFENVTSDSMSTASLEMTASMLADIMDQFLDDVSTDRKKTQHDIMAAVNMGVLTDEESLSMGLIDRLGFADEMMVALNGRLSAEENADASEEPSAELPAETSAESFAESSAELPVVPMGDYLASTHPKKKDDDVTRPVVAVVLVENMIMPTTDGAGGLFADNIAGADEISEALRDAARDDDVAAIVLRVNSPGGSPSASETIRHATAYARAQGKLVIVSMGSVAGSGGYWVATDADHVFAMPTTLTGSIGVVAGKFDLSGLWQKLGVNWDGVSVGQNADMWSMNKGFSATATERMNAMTDRIYDLFIERVAAGRGLSIEAVDKIARGRVWTGRQAHQIGLVDSLGGFNDALDYAAKTLGQNTRHDLHVLVFPDELAPFRKVLKHFGIHVQMPKPIVQMLNHVRATTLPGGVGVYDAGLGQW